MRHRILVFTAAALMLLCGCKKDTKIYSDIPAWLHLDRIEIVERADAVEPSPNGFLSSDIDAVQLVAFWTGDDEETNLGTFQLPCTLPVLRNDTISRLIVRPVVKQNGIAATRIEYPYYETVYLSGIPLVADSTTNIGVQDAGGQWVVSTSYRPWTEQRVVDGEVIVTPDSLFKVLAQEYFEDTVLIFDSKVQQSMAAEDVRTGTGSGVIVVGASASTVDFEINSDIICNDAGAYLYLEMDYKTDVRLSVGMKSAYHTGGNQSTQSAMTLYETSQWKKIYINLGRLWSQFNHNPTFRVVFSALNSEGKGGKVYLDNVKLLQM